MRSARVDFAFRTYPLAVRADGTTLIARAYQESSFPSFFSHDEGSIRFLDLATGREVQPALSLGKSDSLAMVQFAGVNSRTMTVG